MCRLFSLRICIISCTILKRIKITGSRLSDDGGDVVFRQQIEIEMQVLKAVAWSCQEHRKFGSPETRCVTTIILQQKGAVAEENRHCGSASGRIGGLHGYGYCGLGEHGSVGSSRGGHVVHNGKCVRKSGTAGMGQSWKEIEMRNEVAKASMAGVIQRILGVGDGLSQVKTELR
jgi:hypothetical protein